MNKLRELKYTYLNYKVNRKYRKLDKCNLPFRFYNKKSEQCEWVNYKNFIDNTSRYDSNIFLLDALSDICKIGLTYHYNINNNKKDKNYQNHSHDFDSVLKDLYFYPESFNIPDEFKNNYSRQELNYINELQKFLLFIELKDFKNSKEYYSIEEKCKRLLAKDKINLIDKAEITYLSKKGQKINYQDMLDRCHNKKYAKYQDYGELTFPKEKIENITENGQDFLIYYSPFFKNEDDMYSTIGHKYLLKDENYNILASIEIIENKKMKFKDFNQTMAIGIKDFPKYKNDINKNYIELDKNFNDESFIVYEKIKMLEKF